MSFNISIRIYNGFSVCVIIDISIDIGKITISICKIMVLSIGIGIRISTGWSTSISFGKIVCNSISSNWCQYRHQYQYYNQNQHQLCSHLPSRLSGNKVPCHTLYKRFLNTSIFIQSFLFLFLMKIYKTFFHHWWWDKKEIWLNLRV